VTTWYDIRDPQDPQLDELAAKYKLHALHIEDCRHRNQNAKVEPQDGYIFVVLKPVEMDAECVIDAGDLDIFLGADYLITVQETACPSLTQILSRVRSVANNLRPDQLFYRIADGVVDSYLPILDGISEKIDGLEDQILEDPQPDMLQQLFDLRRALIQLRRIMSNSRDVMGNLGRNEYPQLGRDLAPFLRDVYDHVTRNLDTIEIHRDLLTGAMELYLSSVANRTNQVMKVLTIFGTIATPALVITGLYGMNLQHLPFANHPHSWGIVISLIAAVSGFMLLVLRKLRWL
jgi:magnesium transporter